MNKLKYKASNGEFKNLFVDKVNITELFDINLLRLIRIEIPFEVN